MEGMVRAVSVQKHRKMITEHTVGVKETAPIPMLARFSKENRRCASGKRNWA